MRNKGMVVLALALGLAPAALAQTQAGNDLIVDLKNRIIDLQNKGNLGFRAFTACSSITSYGSYVPLPAPVVAPGTTMLFYYEPENVFTNRRDGLYEVRFTQDMVVSTTGGDVLSSKDDALSFHFVTRSPVLDLYAANTLSLGGLPAGEYVFRAVIHDKLKNADARIDYKFAIGAPGSAAGASGGAALGENAVPAAPGPSSQGAARGAEGSVKPPVPDGTFFEAGDRTRVLATAPTGAPLRQSDVDLYGGLMGWAFGTRLTEAQKATVRDAVAEFWKAATPQFLQDFDQGVRSMPNLIPRLPAEAREQLRVGMANIFLMLAQSSPGHSLSQVILAVSSNARQVLAGAGTATELTQQDVDSLLEYLCFQSQVQTGQAPVVTPEQRAAFTAQIAAAFASASDQEKQTLARMDASWAQFRTAWTLAQAAQQQALATQWQQAAAARQAAGPNVAPVPGRQAGSAPGQEMSDSQFNTVRDAMNTLHYSSMQVLGGIDGSYGDSVYDSSGNWLYDE